MQLSDKIKKFSVEQAIDYLNRNPVKNLPKLLDWRTRSAPASSRASAAPSRSKATRRRRTAAAAKKK